MEDEAMGRPRPTRMQRIAASIEVTPRQAVENVELSELIPKGVRVYIADIGKDPDDVLVRGARRLSDLGYVAVPHLVARRCPSRARLDDRIKALAQDAGVRDVLVVGGSVDKPAGGFSSTMEVLDTGLLDLYGVTEIGVAGHPEGSPDFPESVAIEALGLKSEFAKRTGARMRIVTQFAFSSDAIVRWAGAIREHGVDLPVHVGIAGPAKLTTLIKYAATCGVGNSVQFLRRQARSITALATAYSPEHLVEPIESHILANPASGIEQLHVFPFGGLAGSARWLKARGSWGEGPATFVERERATR